MKPADNIACMENLLNVAGADGAITADERVVLDRVRLFKWIKDEEVAAAEANLAAHPGRIRALESRWNTEECLEYMILMVLINGVETPLENEMVASLLETMKEMKVEEDPGVFVRRAKELRRKLDADGKLS